MKPSFRKIVLVIWSLIPPFCQYLFLGRFSLNINILGDVITFLSILCGFYITSLAILGTSRYVHELYLMPDREKPGSTLLHNLVNRYKLGLAFMLVFIVYVFFLEMVLGPKDEAILTLNQLIVVPLSWFLVVTLVYTYVMLRYLALLIIQDAKTSKD